MKNIALLSLCLQNWVTISSTNFVRKFSVFSQNWRTLTRDRWCSYEGCTLQWSQPTPFFEAIWIITSIFIFIPMRFSAIKYPLEAIQMIWEVFGKLRKYRLKWKRRISSSWFSSEFLHLKINRTVGWILKSLAAQSTIASRERTRTLVETQSF